MSERLKEHDWKSCVDDESTEGSNPSLSAFDGHGEFHQPSARPQRARRRPVGQMSLD